MNPIKLLFCPHCHYFCRFESSMQTHMRTHIDWWKSEEE